ncbi:MAG TPA: TonB C-terminal domain-containing protein [Aquabacterium sp.]|nr:TonB C-terminal domain-containing protein [Aquabacterium sp.]
MSLVMPMPDHGDDAHEGWKAKAVMAMLIAAILGGLVWWVTHTMRQPASGPQRQTVKIAVLPDTPPPPPPPKEKPPEPEKQELKPQMQQEPVKPQEAPPAPAQLKMDGPAGDGPSAFAAGQVATEYKGGEIGLGNGGGNRLQFALFTNKLTRHIQLALSRNKDVKFDFRVNVQVWLSPNGSFQKVVLDSSTGDEQMDGTLRAALTHLPPIDGVPGNLPQPLLLRITNRLTG